MSDITTSSTYSVGNKSYSNRGLSSLVSGMDTDSMVKKLLSGTQSKIDKQQQSKQVLEWKQDMYRDVITSINKFQSTYFDTSFDSTLKTNLVNANMFNSMASTATSGSDCVKITGSSSDAAIGNMTVGVTQLASEANITGNANLSNNTISGKIPSDDAIASNQDFSPRTVEFTVNSSSGSSSVVVDLSGTANTTDMVNKLNQKLNSKGVSAQLSSSGALEFITDSRTTSIGVNSHSSKTTVNGLSTLGFTGTSVSSASDTLGAQILYGASAPDTTVGNTFTITLNGVSKQITLDPTADANGKVTQAAVKSALANSIATAYGGTVDDGSYNVTGGYIDLTFTGSNFSLSLKDEDSKTDGIQISSQFNVTGMKASNIGMTPGASSRVSSSSTLNELTGEKVGDIQTSGKSGDIQKFTINGQEFTFTGSDTLYSVMNAVNSSSAGVKMSYSSLTDKFKIDATSSGANYGITIQQSEGNLLTKLLGDSVPAGSVAGSSAIGTTKITGDSSMLTGGMSSASFKINVNGADYNFTVPSKPKTDSSPYTVSDILSTINSGLKDKFGSNGAVANISIDTTTGNLMVNDGSIVKFAQSTVATNKSDKVSDAQNTDLAYRLGFSVSGKSNIASADTKVSDLSSSAKTALNNAGISDSTTLSAAASALSASTPGLTFDSKLNRFTGTQARLTILQTNQPALFSELFGAKSDPHSGKVLTSGVDLSKLSGTDHTVTTMADITDPTKIGSAGHDAAAVVNGTAITRSSNSFTVDGVSMELTKVTTSTATISTARDTDTIVKTVKQFVDDYNKLTTALRGQTDEDATYTKYPPLTDDQKSDMKDSEITAWDKKSKTGLLRNDSDIMTFLDNMRSTMYTKPTNSNFAMYDIGIETESYSSGDSSLGTLTFDETAFRKALSEDPLSVTNLFTDKQSGIAVQLSKICDNAAKISLTSPGSLVQLAGVTSKSWSTKNNEIYSQVKDIDDKIADLKERYEDERTRYWKKFNDMETTVSNYNTQSGWLASQFSS